MKRHDLLELKRALSFLVSQIQRGYTTEEAFTQVGNAYGNSIRAQCGIAIRNNFKRDIIK